MRVYTIVTSGFTRRSSSRNPRWLRVLTSRSNSGSAIESTWLTCPARLKTKSARAAAGSSASASPRSASITSIGRVAPPRLGGFAPCRGTRASATESTAAFSPVVRPPEGAPNVVVIVLDDLGFGQLGCFGADIATPAIDALATNGLRYNRFHVTALCSPTRACLLTGRNHHAVGMGFLTDIPIGFPGYDGRIPPSAGTLPRILRDAGYNTFAVGK